LITGEEDWQKLPPASASIATAKLIFRVDSFDPMTRIRRGRLYYWHVSALQQEWHNTPHPGAPMPELNLRPNGTTPMRLHTFYPKLDLADQWAKSRGMLIALGTRNAATVWRIISVENGYLGEDIVTLRARSSFGALPELDSSKVSVEAMGPVSTYLDKVVDASFRAGPESLVDMCRAAVTVVLSHWLAQQGEPTDKLFALDVGDLLAKVERRYPGENEMSALKASVRLLQRFHSRGKPNEQVRYNTRPPTEDDAELVLQALGFIVREIGWAR